VQHDPARRDNDRSTEFEQVIADHPDLCPSTRSLLRMQPQLLHQHISSRCQEDAELICPEARATGTVKREPQLQFLDPVLDLASCTIYPLVDEARAVREGGDDEAGVVFGLAARMPHHFGLNDDTSRVRPGAGGISALTVDMLCFPALTRASPCMRHEPFGPVLEDGVFGHGDDVVDSRFAIEKVEDLGCSKAAIETHPDARLGEGPAHPLDQTSENPHCPRLVGSVPRSKNGGTQVLIRLIVEAQETQHWQVAPAIIIAVEKGELLRSVGGILGRVEIDRDPSGFAPQSAAMAFDDRTGERFADAKKFLGANAVLEARKCRLACQRGAVDRVATDEHLVDGIICQASGVVAIGVAARHREHSLPNELGDLVGDLGGITSVFDASGQAFGQPQSLIGGFQKHRTPVRTAMVLVEPGDDGLGKKFWKNHTLCRSICSQGKASFVVKDSVITTFLPQGGFHVSKIHE